MIAMTEAEAAAFFSKINRPMPRDPQMLHAVGVKAVEEAMKRQARIDRAAIRAVRSAVN